MFDLRLGIIGAGNMAEAILNSVLKNDLFAKERISIFDKIPEKLEQMQKKGVVVCNCNREVVLNSDIILIAIKPQDIASMLTEISEAASKKCLLSIAAGVSTDYIKRFIMKDTYVVRVMPNTPIMIGCGSTAVALSPKTPKNLFDVCVEIFARSGEAEIIDESLMNEIIGVNGSSPAYFYYFADAIAHSAELQGIDYDTALRLAAKAMEGSAKMILETNQTAKELITKVSSPGGTTIAALLEFDRYDLSKIIEKAMLACTKRARELAE